MRGLVVGSVQSGKTANFNAVINSAIDVGYDLIIVLSGIMEDLRVQTQRRIEKEVEGKFENGAFIGVGTCASFGPQGYYSNVHQIVVPTSTETDFKKTIKEADFSLNSRNILVCKKNTGVLKNLLLWLETYLHKNRDKISIPLLIIDDEADNASLNNLGEKGQDYTSTINGHIRALLGLFEKKTYLGYTATPFGNVLQDRNEASENKWPISDKKKIIQFSLVDSLFPNDFIELLFPPPNYIGAKHFFETRLNEVKKIDPLITAAIKDHLQAFPPRVTTDDEKPTLQIGKGTRATRKDDPFPTHIPTSLEEAVMCFILSTAIRLTRKNMMRDSKLYQPHNTMLIHISRFTTWQTRTKKLVQEFVDKLERELNNALPRDETSVYGHFENIWNKHYAYVMENIWTYLPDKYEDEYLVPKTFVDVKSLLFKVVESIEVKAVNSVDKEKLVYPEGDEKVYIAIGGNRLSRGFTLEGLTVNYFVRNTNFADTLLQMGRWFGYRPGYIDCCKLFATNDSLEKFDQTTVTIENLEQNFIEMNRDPSNTPSTFALKVLKHPGVLKITRPSILKNSEEVNWSYSDQLEQTTKFKIDKLRLEAAWSGFKGHIQKHSKDFKKKQNEAGKTEYLEYSVDSVETLFSFLDLPNAFNDSSLKEGEDYFQEIKDFILECNKHEKLTDWSVVIKASGTGGKLNLEELGIPCVIDKSRRVGPSDKAVRWRESLIQDHVFAAGGASANILSGGKDMSIRLTDEVIRKAIDDFKEEWINDFRNKNPNLTNTEVLAKKKTLTVPEKVFRRKMSSKEGLLVIYLMDLKHIFMPGDEPIQELQSLQSSLDMAMPLIGYAIGFPIISESIGGTYLQSKYHEEPEVRSPDDDEYDEYKDVLEM